MSLAVLAAIAIARASRVMLTIGVSEVRGADPGPKRQGRLLYLRAPYLERRRRVSLPIAQAVFLPPIFLLDLSAYVPNYPLVPHAGDK